MSLCNVEEEWAGRQNVHLYLSNQIDVTREWNELMKMFDLLEGLITCEL
jgi:hypothetical protein